MNLLGIAGEAYRVGECWCGAKVKLNRKPGWSECRPCGSIYDNITGKPATELLLAEMGHQSGKEAT